MIKGALQALKISNLKMMATYPSFINDRMNFILK